MGSTRYDSVLDGVYLHFKLAWYGEKNNGRYEVVVLSEHTGITGEEANGPEQDGFQKLGIGIGGTREVQRFH